mmetsp:Transcript_15500/g.40832  ORF Transcript_15500/g.40832 Transcript_15500/m.40832 type:complete len:243 (+) Transcript_15500:500-1228(+)
MPLMYISSFCSLLVVLSLSAVAMASAPSSPSLLLPRLHSVKEAMTGSSPATTRPPTTSICCCDSSSLVRESARISLIGISLNFSILVLARTAAASCDAPSPEMLLLRTPAFVKEALTPAFDRSDASRIASGGLRPSPTNREPVDVSSGRMPQRETSLSLTASTKALAAGTSRLFFRTLQLVSEALTRRASAMATQPSAPILLLCIERLVSEALMRIASAIASAIAVMPSSQLSGLILTSPSE